MKIITSLLLVIPFVYCSRQRVNNYLDVTGIIEAKEILINAKVSGGITSILVDEWLEVQKGDTLAILMILFIGFN